MLLPPLRWLVTSLLLSLLIMCRCCCCWCRAVVTAPLVLSDVTVRAGSLAKGDAALATGLSLANLGGGSTGAVCPTSHHARVLATLVTMPASLPHSLIEVHLHLPLHSPLHALWMPVKAAQLWPSLF